MTDTIVQPDDQRSYRMSNIDMMRGLVIIIMAIDHVRDYFYFSGSGVSISDPDIEAAFYLTRWITHFCAPVFVFFAGTSVGLMEGRRTRKELAKFVFTRGVWLIFCEIFLISTALSFRPFGDEMTGGGIMAFLQVLFALGVSMIALSGLLFLGARNCLILGLLIIVGHNALGGVWPEGQPFSVPDDPMWVTLMTPGTFLVIPFYSVVLYPPIPWTGVILLGYGSTFIFQKDPAERDMLLRKIGFAFIAAFVLLRFIGIYGDPNPWQTQELGIISTLFDFFDVTKYPPSLLYLLITLGLMAILCSYADRFQGWLKDMFVMFGRVPFAFYVVHFYLIHTLSVLFGMWQGFEAHQMAHMFPFYPQGYGTSLIGVYAVWLLVLAVLYPFCKWVMKLKSSRKDWWLSYL
jgi:uncharacterized membrane protein